MQQYRQSLHAVQMLEKEANNTRLCWEALRSLCAIASSNFMFWQLFKCGNLRLLTQDFEDATPAWLIRAYREAPRSLSMDASRWTRWKDPMDAQIASGSRVAVHFAPRPGIAGPPVRRRWRDCVLTRLKPRASVPGFVSAFRQGQPSTRPRSPEVKKRPRPREGGFIEHLNENRRFRSMLKVHGRRDTQAKNKSEVAQKAEAVMDGKGSCDATDKVDVGVSEQEDGKGEDGVRVDQGVKRRINSWMGRRRRRRRHMGGSGSGSTQRSFCLR